MKKKIAFILTVIISLSAVCANVYAAEVETADGFYDIGTNQNVTIKPYVNNTEAILTEQDVDGDQTANSWYKDSDRLLVSYNNAVVGEYYSVMLVEGSEIPTSDSQIYFADQITAESGTVNFNVYPTLPDRTTEMSLYIISKAEGFELIKIPLGYAAEVVLYTIGDINDDGEWNSVDSLSALMIHTGMMPSATEAQRSAADVNRDGKVNTIDALKILQYGAGLINSWTD